MTLGDVLDRRPVELCVLTVLPLVLAGFQTWNAFAADLPLSIALAFCVGLVGFATASFISLHASVQVSALEDRWLE